MRQVYRINKAGSINDLRLVQEEIPALKTDEVCVQVRAIGLNFADIFAIQGLYSATPKGSFIPGLEYSGEIVQIGENVQGRKVGDKVMGVTKFGGYATHITINERYVLPLPESWSFEEGAGFLVQGLTAYYALTTLGNLQPGMTVLIHSAAGGVGLLANRIARKLGAFTVGTVGRSDKVKFLLKEECYDLVIVRDKHFPENLKAALQGRPLNLIMECIGGKILQQGWQMLAPMGRMVVYGNASFTSHGSRPNYPKLFWKFLNRPKIDPLKLPTENKSLMGFNLIYLYEQTEMMHQLLAELEKLELGPPFVGQVFAFEDMHQAIHQFQQGKTVGKVVVKVGGIS